MDGLTRHRTADAPPSVVWDVITDQALYADVAPNLATVEVLGGEGTGHVRRCVDTDGNVWTESCSHWEKMRRTNAWTEPRPIEGSVRITPITNALPSMVELRPLAGDEGNVCGLGGDADVDS